jgi:hypothetical protein
MNLQNRHIALARVHFIGTPVFEQENGLIAKFINALRSLFSSAK